MKEKLTEEQFTLLAIKKKKKNEGTTIHTVFSGFNDAFRDYFPGVNPVEAVKKLVADGKVAFRLSRGGAIIGKPGSIQASSTSSKETLGKMGLNK